MDRFYSKFAALYGENNCGLNVHNAGTHYIYYVKQWGPMSGWSRSPFEDLNHMLLQSVHGTGDVMKQAILQKMSRSSLRNETCTDKQTKKWANLKKVPSR